MRKFNKKLYEWCGRYRSKAVAQQEAERLRRVGHQARITQVRGKTKTVYDVWFHGARRSSR